MMHLSDEQFAHVLEGDASIEVRAHVEACETCRTMVEAARAAWHTAAAVDVPEPSPLFWDHLSARVREEIDREPAQETSAWRQWLSLSGSSPRGWVAVAGALGVAVLVAAVAMRPSPPIGPNIPNSLAMSPEPNAEIELAAFDGAIDQQWELMMDVAADVELDDSALGLGTGPVDQAWEELSDEERGEVATWLRQELAVSPLGGTL